MFICQNQPCGAQWSPAEVTIKNEGQGPMFRCPLCNARNPLVARQRRDGTIDYKQARGAEKRADGGPQTGRRA